MRPNSYTKNPMHPNSKPRLGLRDFSKSLYRKNWQNKPVDSTHQDKPICTLEYMVWPIRTGRNVPMKIQCANSFIVIVKIQNSLNSIRLPNVLHITMWMRWLWLGCISECGPLPSKLGCNTTLRPSAVGWYCTPISQEIGPRTCTDASSPESTHSLSWHVTLKTSEFLVLGLNFLGWIILIQVSSMFVRLL